MKYLSFLLLFFITTPVYAVDFLRPQTGDLLDFVFTVETSGVTLATSTEVTTPISLPWDMDEYGFLKPTSTSIIVKLTGGFYSLSSSTVDSDLHVLGALSASSTGSFAKLSVSDLVSGGIVIGGGTGLMNSLAVQSNGQIPIGDGSGPPTLATLTAGTNITIDNAAGSITINAAGSEGGGGFGESLSFLDIANIDFLQPSTTVGLVISASSTLDGIDTWNSTSTNATATDFSTTRINIGGNVLDELCGTGITCTGTLSSSLGISIAASEIADGDHGNFTYTTGNAVLDADVVGDSALDTTAVTLNDFLNDSGYITNSTIRFNFFDVSTLDYLQPTSTVGLIISASSTIQALAVQDNIQASTSISVGTGGVFLSGVTGCTEALETGSDGQIICGTDATGVGGATPANHGTTTITFIADVDGAGLLCSNCPVLGTEFNPKVVVDLDGANKLQVGANCDVACAATIFVEIIDEANVALTEVSPTVLDTPVLSTTTNETVNGTTTLNVRIKGSAQAAEDFRVTHVYLIISPQ